MNRDVGKPRLDWRDVACYALAALAWVLLAAISAAALLAVRSTVGPLVIAILLRNPYSQTHYYLLSDRAGVADRIVLGIAGLLWIVYVLISEEYLRSSAGDARALRIRQASAGTQPEHGWQSRGLGTLTRRMLVAAAFPAAIAALFLVLQLAFWLLLRF